MGQKITLVFRPHPKGHTKGTFKMEEVTVGGMPPKIGTLYVQRWALEGKEPTELTLTVEAK